MAVIADEKIVYPRIPESCWWRIRNRVKKSVPTKIDTAYLGAVLGVKQRSAANLVPMLQRIGLIDNDCRPTPLLNEWRYDSRYPSVCAGMIAALYPEEFRSAFGHSDVDRSEIENWFAFTANSGSGTAKILCAFYLLLLEADVSKEDKVTTASKNGNRKSKPTLSTADSQSKPAPSGAVQNAPKATPGNGGSGGPARTRVEVCVNVQVVIPDVADAEMIDNIFRSMAQHLRISE